MGKNVVKQLAVFVIAFTMTYLGIISLVDFRQDKKPVPTVMQGPAQGQNQGRGVASSVKFDAQGNVIEGDVEFKTASKVEAVMMAPEKLGETVMQRQKFRPGPKQAAHKRGSRAIARKAYVEKAPHITDGDAGVPDLTHLVGEK